MYAPRWRAAIKLDRSDLNSFHPVLINAIAGIATSICTPEYKGYSEGFIHRAILCADQSLADVDRIEDWMWARVLLFWYWVRCGKISTVR